MEAFSHYAAENVKQMHKMLRNLDAWLERATVDATNRKYDVDVLVTSRLAPDQFALGKQVQSSCDTAKFLAARLAGVEAPTHADTETTVAQLRERIAAVTSWLEQFSAHNFAAAAERKLSAGWMQGRWQHAPDYLLQYAVPNFYFHLTTAYAILRHNGVDLGKRNFLGAVTLHAD